VGFRPGLSSISDFRVEPLPPKGGASRPQLAEGRAPASYAGFFLAQGSERDYMGRHRSSVPLEYSPLIPIAPNLRTNKMNRSKVIVFVLCLKVISCRSGNYEQNDSRFVRLFSQSTDARKISVFHIQLPSGCIPGYIWEMDEMVEPVYRSDLYGSKLKNGESIWSAISQNGVWSFEIRTKLTYEEYHLRSNNCTYSFWDKAGKRYRIRVDMNKLRKGKDINAVVEDF
jgi:hypothetical protein